MTHYKFLSFEKTPSIENQLGIVSVLIDDKWMVRFKIVNRKDGSGFFIAGGNVKGEPTEPDKTNWLDCFVPDRNSEKEELYNFIRASISKPSVSKPSVTKPCDDPRMAQTNFNDNLPF